MIVHNPIRTGSGLKMVPTQSIGTDIGRFASPLADPVRLDRYSHAGAGQLRKGPTTTMKEAELKQKLREFICAELLFEAEYPLRNDESLLATGRLNSLLLVQLAMYIEETFGGDVPNIDLTAEHFETVDRMAAWLIASMNL